MVFYGEDDNLIPDDVIDSSLVLTLRNLKGNAVAISRTLALTAVHDKGKIGDTVTLRTKQGVILPGVIVFYAYTKDLIDIAVVELTSSDEFSCNLSVNFEELRIAQQIFVVGLKVGAFDESMQVVHPCYVNAIERATGSAMFQSNYTSFDGLSGAGVVTKVVGNTYKVVGVHVASHDDTIKHPPVKKARKESTAASVTSVNLACESLASNIHGHHAFCLICEVARVADLVQFLRDRGLQ